MVRNWKLASAGTSLFLAVTALALYAFTRTPNAPTFQFANGIQVTPIEVKPDDMAQLLEIRTWKFDVVQPDASKPLYLSLSLCREGKFSKTIMGGLGIGPEVGSHHAHGVLRSHVTLSLAPVGDTFFGARQLKYLLRTEGAGTSGTMSNPIFKGHGEVAETQAASDDNMIFLMSTNKIKPSVNSVMASNDTTLALSLSGTPPR